MISAFDTYFRGTHTMPIVSVASCRTVGQTALRAYTNPHALAERCAR
jgi:hypothetical protein